MSKRQIVCGCKSVSSHRHVWIE